jgi:hypothetical protein
MVCLRNISVDTLHKGDTDDDDDQMPWEITQLPVVHKEKFDVCLL